MGRGGGTIVGMFRGLLADDGKGACECRAACEPVGVGLEMESLGLVLASFPREVCPKFWGRCSRVTVAWLDLGFLLDSWRCAHGFFIWWGLV